MMKIARYYQFTMFGIFALLGIIALSTAALYVYTVDHQLTGEYENNSRAIAKSIADSNVEVIVNKDYSTLQSIIDQFLPQVVAGRREGIEGLNYIFVVDDSGSIIAHTFVPGVPKEVMKDYKERRPLYDRTIKGRGEYTEVTCPVLAGEAGMVHVGMDKGYIRLQIQTAIGKQIYQIIPIFIFSIVVSYFLFIRASKPLHLISNYMLYITSRGKQGEQPPPETVREIMGRPDEIGELGRLVHYFTQTEFKQTGATALPRVRGATQMLTKMHTEGKLGFQLDAGITNVSGLPPGSARTSAHEGPSVNPPSFDSSNPPPGFSPAGKTSHVNPPSYDSSNPPPGFSPPAKSPSNPPPAPPSADSAPANPPSFDGSNPPNPPGKG